MLGVGEGRRLHLPIRCSLGCALTLDFLCQFIDTGNSEIASWPNMRPQRGRIPDAIWSAIRRMDLLIEAVEAGTVSLRVFILGTVRQHGLAHTVEIPFLLVRQTLIIR